MSEGLSTELPHVDGYRLIELLARGSSGDVYRAREHETQDIKAVKILKKGECAKSPRPHECKKYIEQFSEIHNSALVLPHAVVEQKDACALIMDYIEGDTIARLVDRHDLLPTARGIEVAYSLLEAIDTLHRHGFEHGALNPEKIFIKGGTVFIAGAGVAPWRAGDGSKDIADLGEIIERVLQKPIPHELGVLLSSMMRQGDASSPQPSEVAEYLDKLRTLKKRYSNAKSSKRATALKQQNNYSDELDVFHTISDSATTDRWQKLFATVSKYIAPIVIVGLGLLIGAVMFIDQNIRRPQEPNVPPQPVVLPEKNPTPPHQEISTKESSKNNEQFEQAFAELKGILSSLRQHPELAERHRERLKTLAEEAKVQTEMSLLVGPINDAIREIDNIKRRAEEREYAKVAKFADGAEKRGAYNDAISAYKKFIASGLANKKLRARAEGEIAALEQAAERAYLIVLARAKAASDELKFAEASLYLTEFAETAKMALISQKVSEAVRDISFRRRTHETAQKLRLAKEETEKKIATLKKSFESALKKSRQFEYKSALLDLRAFSPEDMEPDELATRDLADRCKMAAEALLFLQELLEFEAAHFERCAARVETGERQIPVKLTEDGSPKRVIKITEKSILLRGVAGEIELSWMSFSVRSQLSFFNEMYGNPDVFEERLTVAIMAFTREAFEVLDEHLDAAEELACTQKQRALWTRISKGIDELISQTPILPQ